MICRLCVERFTPTEWNVENISESCPLCGTELSKIKFAEIQTKIREREQQQLSEQKKGILEAESALRRQLEHEFNSALQKEKEIAGRLAKQEAEVELTKIVAERDQATKKSEEAEAREAKIRKLAQQEKEGAVKSARQELAEQRAVLEKDKEAALLKQDAEHRRSDESWQKRINELNRQIQKKTANELGDGAEIDLFEALREAFTGDRITRVLKGQPGADILFEVFHKGQSCGLIIIDSKNRQNWQNSYITKLRQDQVEAGAEQAILASNVFPSGKKEMCIESNVIVVNPARVVYIVQVFRQTMVTMHVRGLSMKERAGKMENLYKLITSEAYSQKFNEAGRLTREILNLDVEEKKTHDNVWKKRGSTATRINNVLREIETEVAAVVEGEDMRGDPSPYTVQNVKATSTGIAVENTTIWNKH